MCLAIYKPAGVEIPHKNLENGFSSNSDGSGIAWVQDGKIHVEKGMFDINSLIGVYESAKEYPMLIHFRKATHGPKNEDNCHPFLFADGKYALIHNGVIPIKNLLEGFSDTATFVKTILDPLVKDMNVPINHPALGFLVKQAIGTDKIVVLDEQGNVIFFNEEKGNWEEKAWYSNYSFRNCYGGSKTHYTSNNTHVTQYSQSILPVKSQNSSNRWDGSEWDTQTAPKQLPENTSCLEYGWYDRAIEEEITDLMTRHGINRDEALNRCFLNT